jgi:hypothetical protein
MQWNYFYCILRFEKCLTVGIRQGDGHNREMKKIKETKKSEGLSVAILK